jgi:molybdenum cofactor guanylyltransferase
MGRPKQEMVLADGRTMLEAVVEVLACVCERVVIIGSRELVRHDPKIMIIEDRRLQCGPLGGIEVLLGSGIDSQYLISACDVPRIGGELLLLLADAPANALAIVPHVVGREHAEPLPARLSADALPVVTQLLDQGHRAVWRLMRELDATEIPIPADWSNQLLNINTPEDLSALHDGDR